MGYFFNFLMTLCFHILWYLLYKEEYIETLKLECSTFMSLLLYFWTICGITSLIIFIQKL